MLRLYHGFENACDVIAVEAFHTLLLASRVLSSREKFCYTALEEALADCARRSTASGIESCSTPWNVLCQDVALICRNHRQVARALLEAIDVVHAAIKIAKKKKKKRSGSSDHSSDDGALFNMRRIRKKLEFLLSWFLAHQNAVLCLSGDIDSWVADWDVAASNENNEELRTMQLPQNKLQQRSRVPLPKEASSSLVMQEIDSRQL